jgi:hypothetical protein
VLRAPSSLQRAGNGLLVLLAAPVPEPSEDTRIPLAVEDRAADAPARHPGDVTDDPGEFDVPLLERLLHVLNVVRRVGHQHGALPEVTA